jgi:hypothetical protein
MPELDWFRFCPAAREADAAIYEPLGVVTARFEAAGLHVVTLERVDYEDAPTRRAALDKLRLRALSTFEHLTEDEIEDAFAAMEADIEHNGDGGPILAEADFLILEAPDHDEGRSR